MLCVGSGVVPAVSLPVAALKQAMEMLSGGGDRVYKGMKQQIHFTASKCVSVASSAAAA